MTSSKKTIRHNVHFTVVNISGKFHGYTIDSLEVIKGGANRPPPPRTFQRQKTPN